LKPPKKIDGNRIKHGQNMEIPWDARSFLNGPLGETWSDKRLQWRNRAHSTRNLPAAAHASSTNCWKRKGRTTQLINMEWKQNMTK
jgi:hypothetical protein